MSEVAISADIDVFRADFPAICAAHGLELPTLDPAGAEISEAFAAYFVIALWRSSWWLRWRFPRALSDDGGGGFARWIAMHGARRFGLSDAALKKVRGVFRRSPGERTRDVYLQDRDLQRLFPLALVPAGQRHFLGWLATFGRTDQALQDHEILWFLHEAAEKVADGVGLCYLVNCEWQARFPAALTGGGWRALRKALLLEYPALHHWSAQLKDRPPAVLASARQPGVNVLSHFCYPSGIQQAAIWTKTAFERAGLITSCRDVPAGIKTTLTPRKNWLGLEIFPITVITVAPTPYFVTAYERAGWHRRPGVYRIAYWAWELETIPEEWVAMLPLLDEIWTPTEFVAAAMRTRMNVPVHRMLPGVEVPEVESVSKSDLGIPEDHCVFLFMFDMFSVVERKNPLAAIRAFRRAFRADEKATLVLKTSVGAPDPREAAELKHAADQAGVLLVRQLLSREKAYGYLQMCDCYVSLHRSEGFGLGMAEAMLLGKPVIATGYSGNLDFMNQENSYLIDFQMTDVQEERQIYRSGFRWAEPSMDHAASLMRQVFDNPSEAKAVGARAQEELREKLSLRAAGERMAARLREIETR
ncbi:MAG: glycosyltransferase family 4 protein [Verrucomicrobiota bacterium]|nr:glycosyltransferase family 4 protein [Verrucomicrobiota bacterium]